MPHHHPLSSPPAIPLGELRFVSSVSDLTDPQVRTVFQGLFGKDPTATPRMCDVGKALSDADAGASIIGNVEGFLGDLRRRYQQLAKEQS